MKLVKTMRWDYIHECRKMSKACAFLDIMKKRSHLHEHSTKTNTYMYILMCTNWKKKANHGGLVNKTIILGNMFLNDKEEQLPPLSFDLLCFKGLFFPAMHMWHFNENVKHFLFCKKTTEPPKNESYHLAGCGNDAANMYGVLIKCQVCTQCCLYISSFNSSHSSLGQVLWWLPF